MTAEEFHQWQEEYRLMPFGDETEQLAETAMTVANASGRYKGMIKRKDFIVHYQEPQHEVDTLADKLNVFAKHHNEALKRKAKRGG